MRIKFLGSGSAFVLAHENYQSNVLISTDVVEISDAGDKQIASKHLLYDAGSTINESLHAAGMKSKELDSIFISHLHDDHAGGIETIAFQTYFGQMPFGEKKVKLLGHQQILSDGWDKCWRVGLESIQGQVNTLESYFDTCYLQNNDDFDFYGIDIRPVQTVHVMDNRRIVPSYGLIITSGKTQVYLSGDTQFAPNQILTYFGQVDWIFHDCEFADYPNSVHAQFHELQRLPDKIRAKMYLYHYSLNGKTVEELEKEVTDAGFAGLVKRGQEFTF